MHSAHNALICFCLHHGNQHKLKSNIMNGIDTLLLRICFTFFDGSAFRWHQNGVQSNALWAGRGIKLLLLIFKCASHGLNRTLCSVNQSISGWHININNG